MRYERDADVVPARHPVCKYASLYFTFVHRRAAYRPSGPATQPDDDVPPPPVGVLLLHFIPKPSSVIRLFMLTLRLLFCHTRPRAPHLAIPSPILAESRFRLFSTHAVFARVQRGCTRSSIKTVTGPPQHHATGTRCKAFFVSDSRLALVARRVAQVRRETSAWH